MAKTMHMKGPKVNGERKPVNFPTKADLVDGLDEKLEELAENVAIDLQNGSDKKKLYEIEAGILTAMTLSGQNAKELDKWCNQRIQQGTGFISNKFVIRGCVVSPITGTRNIKVTEGETYSETGMSLVYVDGSFHYIPDKVNAVAAVPQNRTSSAVTYYAYLTKNDEGKYEVKLSEEREGILNLFRLEVPAVDTTDNLDRVVFYDERRIEENYSKFYSARPYTTIALSGYPMIDAPTYQVIVEPLSWSGGYVGNLYAYDLGNNGFKVAATGDADNIEFRWTIINPDV